MPTDAPTIEDLELLRAYEPVVRFNEGELFFPAAVEDYVVCCDLDDLAAREVALGDERRRLERRLLNPSPRPGPHEHLRHRRMPVPPVPRAHRLLRLADHCCGLFRRDGRDPAIRQPARTHAGLTQTRLTWSLGV